MAELITIREDGTRRVQTTGYEESRVVQSEAPRADIKNILKRFAVQGISIQDHMRNVDLVYKDVSEFRDFADMARATKDAEAAFMKLPSKVREVFDHDHLKWLDAAHDPDKLAALQPELEKLGLWKKAEEAPQAAAAVSAPQVKAGRRAGEANAAVKSPA